MSERIHKKRVLIIGGGPTGMTLACHLLQQGIPCRVIEKRARRTTQSKAINISAASMQMFDRMGFADRFLPEGRKVGHIYVHWQNKRIIHVNYDMIEAPYSFFLSMPQAMSEKILNDCLNSLGGRIERNIELTGIAASEDGVEVELQHEDGRVEKGFYDYAIACDGAKSAVRQYLELPFTGYDYHQHYHLFDGYIDCHGTIEDTHYFVTEKGYFIIAPMVGGYYRMVLYDESKGTHSISHDECQQLIDEFGPGNLQLKEMLWYSKGFFYNRLLENFRYKQRVFFAGDSAHVFSPLGGHGMNTSLQDADNLAWKLAGVINHRWSDEILDTYNGERREIAQLLIKNTDFSTRLINKIERALTTNIENWLPKMRNRGTIRRRASYQFSGLAQQYHLEEFISNTRPNGGEEKLVGCYLPYFDHLEQGGRTVNTYRLNRKVPVILHFGLSDEEIRLALQPYGLPLVDVVSKKSAESGEGTVIDAEEQMKKRCGLVEGDLLLLRPDGVVGFKMHRSCMEEVQDYLGRWFVKEEALI